MPIYEFRCNVCGHRFAELFRHISGADEGEAPPCPHCSGRDTERIVSTFAVHGPGKADAHEVAAQEAVQERQASITTKKQIDKWRSVKKAR